LAVSLAVELLGETSGRQFGLPQLSSVSDVLADVYIAPMRRHLVRSGFQVWSYADDFRVACRSYDEALRALEAADEGARLLGLVLNELKTATPGVDKYRDSLTALRDRERALFAHLDVEELREFAAKDLMAVTTSPSVTCGFMRSSCSGRMSSLVLPVWWLPLFATGRCAGVKLG
jgi:hypothetical protein